MARIARNNGRRSKETVSAFGHKIKKSDLFKLVGLVCFIALVFGIVAALWPSLSLIFELTASIR